jgi:prepilin peptidase CpaA
MLSVFNEFCLNADNSTAWLVAWGVTLTLVVAAIIDGWKLKVPNWLTFPMVLAGWATSFVLFGWAGLGYSLAGTAVGLAVLLPAYAVGGMGAGDVKLMAGVGAWVGVSLTLWAFAASAIVGGVIAIVMVLARQRWWHHQRQFFMLLYEMWLIRSPEAIAANAAGRKSRMMLLPYGIPIAIGSIGYFAYRGMLL